MLDDIIYLYEHIKELLEYVNGPADQPAKNEISAILDADEAERNETISQIAKEHGYAKRCSVDGNNNELSPNGHAVQVKYSEPSSKIYDLRKTKKIKKEKNCSCCNSQ